MTPVIDVQANGCHRGERFENAFVIGGLSYPDKPDFRIKGTGVIGAQLHTGWWIIAASALDDATFEDIGPFKTAELAWSTLMLIKD